VNKLKNIIILLTGIIFIIAVILLFYGQILYSFILSILLYFEIFGIGIYLFKRILEKPEIDKRKFFYAQIVLFVSLAVLLYFSNTKPFLGSMQYFEMGSYSLIISTFIFGYLNKKGNEKPKKICLLTLSSSFIFIFLGLVLSLSEITNNFWITPIQNSGFFLGSYNLLFSVLFLFDYFIDIEGGSKKKLLTTSRYRKLSRLRTTGTGRLRRRFP